MMHIVIQLLLECAEFHRRKDEDSPSPLERVSQSVVDRVLCWAPISRVSGGVCKYCPTVPTKSQPERMRYYTAPPNILPSERGGSLTLLCCLLCGVGTYIEKVRNVHRPSPTPRVAVLLAPQRYHHGNWHHQNQRNGINLSADITIYTP